MKSLWYAMVLWLLPLFTWAQGLVPCNPRVENGKVVDTCGICEAGKLIDNVADWLVTISGVLVVLIIIAGGMTLVLSGGNAGAKGSARKIISTALVGYAILLGAWLIVDTFLKFMIPGSSYGVNNPLMC